ncbi:DUF1134 domain-containing protein [Thiorhodococcus mannitoliphagus]|uniref:DUF1134 domain-containing protein n=1 Tax=Thiorhodococcus mannitoliphagus TaxID=329406 RepID=A0A6P1E2R1_9GAMM|nr:DUF1134 domain-containing protein [Thiorhodococcus mannitoliphagus]NEX22304.1 DUF1134 domain-containing protein [Thiorhodococcus mannitoliphagus]
MIRKHRQFIGLFAFLVVLLSGSLAFAADSKQSVGTVSIEEEQFGLILGGSRGDGTLTFEGKEYPFKLSGLSAGANVGISKMSAAGNVYDLSEVGQFPGTYTKLDASVALGGGMGGTRLKNENGVIMTLHSRTQGVDLNLGNISGVTITMEE